MTEDISILKNIIENSGRESYITDEKFNVLWTNSETSLIEILLESNHGALISPKEKESAISCADGSALKITPLLNNGIPQGYMFEKYQSNQIVDMLSKTSVFKHFSRQYIEFRESTMELLAYLQSPDLGKYSDEYISDASDILSNSANKSVLFKILLNEDEPLTVDLYVAMSYCCGTMQMISNRVGFEIDSEISPGLFVSTHHTLFEYVLINLLLNAFAYNSSEEKEILVKGFRSDDFVVVEVHDNGTDIDLKKINSFRTLYAANLNENGREGLGIAIAQIFADKYGGNLELCRSELGGLCVRLKLKYKIPDNRISLFSPEFNDEEDKMLIDLFSKCFTAEELFGLSEKQKLLPH